MMQVTLDTSGAMAPAAVTDPITRNAYTPYGAVRGADNLTIDHGWLNKIADTDTGLTYLGARYYDPLTSRFISPDPLMNPMDPRTLDAYMYANNNPGAFSDPTGLYAPGDEAMCGHYGCVGGMWSVKTVKAGSYAYAPARDSGGTGTAGGPGGGKAKPKEKFPALHWPSLGDAKAYDMTDRDYGMAQLASLWQMNGDWNHWNDRNTEKVEAGALGLGYDTGGHTYVGGPICGIYAVCIAGVDEVGPGENTMTFGRVILSEREALTPYLQLHEFGHVVDFMHVGSDKFYRDYGNGAIAGWFKGDAHDRNWMEETADRRRDAALPFYEALGVNPNKATTERILMPPEVQEIFSVTSYGEKSVG
jgi:RHS repeat-associated protein